ncbi:hypothetical protein BDU57DRAFT_145450 [Ampelomyces quisqualis]|uniref:Uncharacterized protein n=1 Tax=Ampelomyces quisqualis TaxID=50730 RepID=A0A6A5QVU3_AMPQU|nr:hypothetical protein BDU57DRAFT_145450 [Ampelomyces quisqualis]
MIETGAVGSTIEEYSRAKTSLFAAEEMQHVIRRAMRAAVSLGVPDLVVKARADSLCSGSRFGRCNCAPESISGNWRVQHLFGADRVGRAGVARGWQRRRRNLRGG